jgi:hypothetical protein
MTQQQDPNRYEDWGSATPWQQPPPAPSQHQYAIPQQRASVQTYMVPAVLVTLFCFLPTGVAAIVFASQVTAKLNTGDVAGAMKASASARTWVIVSLVAGVVLLAVIMLASLGETASDYSY